MDVHVPEAGYEIAACGLDHVGVVRDPDLIGGTNCYHAVASDKNGLFGVKRPVRHIDHSDIPEGHGRGISLGAGTQ
jgi:hypothetical protein